MAALLVWRKQFFQLDTTPSHKESWHLVLQQDLTSVQKTILGEMEQLYTPCNLMHRGKGVKTANEEQA